MAPLPDGTQWIRSTTELEQLVRELPAGAVALDLEADSFHHYPEKICLVQLSCAGQDWLLDPLEPLDLSALTPLVSEAARRKVLHGADYDIRMLDRDCALRVAGLFDTMVAARLVGERTFGLAALLEKYFAIRLDKRHQRADWSRRPLPPELATYAVLDTRYLEELATRLDAQLGRMGRRAWAEEEFARIEGLRWSRRAEDPEAFRRVKGAGKLPPRALAVLRELHGLRESVALERDRPPFTVLRDELLIELALAAGDDRHPRPRLPRPWLRPQAARRLDEAIERGAALPDEELPAPWPRRPRRDPALERGVRRLQQRRDEVARRLDLDPSLVASRAVLEKVHRCLESGSDPRSVVDLRSWQADLILD